MTPKLPDLLIADLLVDPTRNVFARERASDSVAFSNVLDAAKGAAAKGAEAQDASRSDTRARSRARADDSFETSKSHSAVDVEARLAHRPESLRAEESDLASEKALQAHQEARSQDLAERRVRAEGITRDQARVAAKSSDQEVGRGELSRAEDSSEILGPKNESETGQAGGQDDGASPESRSDEGPSDDLSRAHGEASGQQASGEVADASSAGVELAAESAIVAGAIAATLSVAAVAVGPVGTGGSPQADPAALMAVGAIQSSGVVGVTGVSGASGVPLIPGELAATKSPADSEISAWGAMSSARAGSAAGGVDQMARQLGLLRSIQGASASAESSRIAQQALGQQGSPRGAESVNAAPAASYNQVAASEGATEVEPAGSATGQVSSGALANAVAATPTTAPLNAQIQAGASASASVSSSATISTGNASANPSLDLNPASSTSSSLVSQLGAALPNGGLLSAEFTPGLSTKAGVVPLPAGAQTTLDPVSVAGSESERGMTAAPDVAEGFAQVARAFDQANAAAQARLSRASSQNQSQTVATNGSPSDPRLPVPGGVVGTTNLITSDLATSAVVLQATQAAAKSVGIIAAAGLALGNAARSEDSRGSADSSYASFSDVSSAVGVLGAIAGSSGSGAGNQSGPGSDSGGRSGSDSLGGIESGTGAIAGGRRPGSAALGAAASAQSAVGTTFGSTMSAANGAIGTSGLEVTASVNAASGSGASAAGAAGAFDAAPSSLPGSGVASAITPQAIGGSLRVDANAEATVRSPVTADQLPVALDQTAIDLARLRGGMLTLELAPADLGRLSFEMRIDDSGAAFVAIRLADDTVRALVENAAGALRDSLSREGFKLDSFTVSSGFGSPEQRENSQNQAFAETSNRRVQSSGSSTSPRESVQSRVSNTQVRPGTSSLSLFA